MIGFKSKPEEILALTIIRDINRADTGAHGMIFEYKSFQVWHSDWRIMLLNSPTRAPVASISEKCRAFLSDPEADLVKRHPNKFKNWQRIGPFPRFDVILDWGK